MAQPTNQFDLFPGARYWRAVQTSVDAILGPVGINRPVQSVGSDFLNVDAWTAERFARLLCEFFSQNPKRLPDRTELKMLLRNANAMHCPSPFIQVAQLPARVSPRVANAIIGGGFHEAFHTKYSKRGTIRIREIEPIIRFAQEVTSNGGAFDAKMRGLLMTFHHLVEDIRIERRGNEDFPGAIQPMRDLQDFILDQEKDYRSESRQEKNVTVTSNARSILLSAFRDLGLGYSTGKSREALARYDKLVPETCAFLKPGGLLKPMLEEAKQLGKADGFGSLRVAMKIVVALWRVQQQKGSPGNQMECPSCGATPKDLIIRSVKNKDGVKVKGRAEMECKLCGFKHEFDLPDNSLNLNQQQSEEEPDERPEIEDLTADDIGEGSDGFGDDTQERVRDAIQNQKKDETPPEGDGEDAAPSEGDGDGDGDDQTSDEGDGDGDGDDGDDQAPSEGDGDDGDSSETGEDGDDEGASSGGADENSDEKGDEGQGSSTGGDENGDEGGNEPSGDGDGDNGDPSDEVPSEGDGDGDEDWEMSGDKFESEMSGGDGAGGPTIDTGSLFEPMLKPVQEILDGDEKDGVLDNRSALGAVVEKEVKEEIKIQEEGQKAGERRWCPLNPSMDLATIVPTEGKGLDELAFQMLEEVRNSGASLQARLRVVVKAHEMTDTLHGVPRGDGLSDRMLVDTAIDLMTNVNPQRAYQTTSLQMDTSFSMAVCLDQSSSVKHILYQLSQVMMVLADSVESIGGETFVFGFRNGDKPKVPPPGWKKNHHRAHAIRYDIFKTWGETFVNTKARFANTRATGTTPMSDGVQFGLMALNPRNAAHRVLVIVTDGRPDEGHTPVIRRQIRLAREAGIQVIGVGIGPQAVFVRQLFGIPNAVWAPTVHEMPTELLMKLNELCDFTGRFRGRRAQLDGDGIMPRQVW